MTKQEREAMERAMRPSDDTDRILLHHLALRDDWQGWTPEVIADVPSATDWLIANRTPSPADLPACWSAVNEALTSLCRGGASFEATSDALDAALG